MKFDPQDPRITAYALGEPLSEADQTFIDTIKSSEEFTTLVNELKSSADAFSNLFEVEAAAEKPVEAKEILDTVEAQPSKGKVISFPKFAPLFITLSGSMAAVFVAVSLLNNDSAQSEEFAGLPDPGREFVYRELPVTIPPELIEGTPQPVNVPNLERITSPTRIVVREEKGAEPVSEPAEQFQAPPAMRPVEPPAVKYSQQKSEGREGILSEDPDRVIIEESMNLIRTDDYLAAAEKIKELQNPEKYLSITENIEELVELDRRSRENPAVLGAFPETMIASKDNESANAGLAPQRGSGVPSEESFMNVAPVENHGKLLNDGLAARERVADSNTTMTPTINIEITDINPRVRVQEGISYGLGSGSQVLSGTHTTGVSGLSLGVGNLQRPAPISPEPSNREGYDRVQERDFVSPLTEALSTFSIDVDTASYANVRRFLEGGQIPPADAVRIEELVNYFDYDYPRPEKSDDAIVPFSVNTDIMSAPWAPEHNLVRIGLQGYEVDWSERPASNLVFLVDVSGSMSAPNKLGLVKQALSELIRKLDARDRVAIVTYAGSSGLALPSTTANNHETIEHALSNLKSGGSTNGGQGIELAYKVAQEHFIKDGNNRVILCTDGDFNVGISNRGGLERLIEEKAQSGVFLSICGFGMGNYQDGLMEHLSNKGNGNYAYIDGIDEARKVFGKDLTGTLITIAKDVKIQVEFNPTHVQAYRLIGYENRALANKDFNDDTKDAGEIGAGHSVTAVYEIIPTGLESSELLAEVDPLKYQTPTQSTLAAVAETSDEIMTVKLRYKEPDGDTSKLITQVVKADQIGQPLSEDLKFISAVTEFGLLLQKSEKAPGASWESLLKRLREHVSKNHDAERSEFLDLAKRAYLLSE